MDSSRKYYRELFLKNGYQYACGPAYMTSNGWAFGFYIYHPMRGEKFFNHPHDAGLLTDEEFISICEKWITENINTGPKVSAYKFDKEASVYRSYVDGIGAIEANPPTITTASTNSLVSSDIYFLDTTQYTATSAEMLQDFRRMGISLANREGEPTIEAIDDDTTARFEEARRRILEAEQRWREERMRPF